MTAAFASDQSVFCHPRAASLFGTTPQTLRVLVAEDDEPNQQVLRMMLERRGYSVRVVANGRQALAALDEESFDLLLLDVRMPEVDGWQVVKSLRKGESENPACGRLPVIALTAMAQRSDRDRCMQAGMDGYLSKPLRTAELYVTLDRVLLGERTKKWSENNSYEHTEGVALKKACKHAPCSAFCQPDVHVSLLIHCTAETVESKPM